MPKSTINKTNHLYFFFIKLNKKEIATIRAKSLSISISPFEDNIYLIKFYSSSWKEAKKDFIKVTSGLNDLSSKIIPTPLSSFEVVFRDVRNIAKASVVWEAFPEIVSFIENLGYEDQLALLDYLFKKVQKIKNRYKERYKASRKLLEGIEKEKRKMKENRKVNLEPLLCLIKEAAYFNISIPHEKIYPNMKK